MRRHIAEEKIALLAGGDLDTREAADFKQHLSQCPECSALLEDYRQGHAALAALGEETTGAAHYQTVRTAVLERLQNDWARPSWIRPVLRWGASAAAILVATALGIWWMRSAQPTHVADISTPAKIAEVEHRVVPQESSRPCRQTTPEKMTASASPRHGPAPARKATPTVPRHRASAESALEPPATKTPPLDDIAVKLETGDPNVIIIWLVSSRGVER